jgi:hypothetical protein
VAQLIRAAENHQGEGKASFLPSPKTAGKRSNTLKSTAAQLKRYTRARQLMRLTTIKDDLAIARDWRSPVSVLSEPMRIDTHCAGNALMASRTIPAAV